jgi:hypothetical protein
MTYCLTSDSILLQTVVMVHGYSEISDQRADRQNYFVSSGSNNATHEYTCTDLQGRVHAVKGPGEFSVYYNQNKGIFIMKMVRIDTIK